MWDSTFNLDLVLVTFVTSCGAERVNGKCCWKEFGVALYTPKMNFENYILGCIYDDEPPPILLG